MAKGKERAESSARSVKSVKSSAPRSPGPRPLSARKGMHTAPDAPSSDAVESRGTVTGNTRADLSPEDVYRLIQETAYFKAKARGFEPGGEVQDWIEAEAEVRRRLETRV
jgi:hypothetical protein